MRRILLVLLCAMLLATASAAVDVTQEQIDNFGIEGMGDGLSDTVSELLPEVSVTQPGDFGDGALAILQNAMPYASSALLSSLRVAVAMTAVVLLCAMVTQMDSKFSKQAVVFAGVLAITLLSVNSLHAMTSLGSDTLQELQTFTGLLLPVLASATVASGGLASSTAIYVGTVFVTNILITLINRILLPMVYAFVALSAAGAVLENQTLKRLKDLTKWLITNSLKLVVFLFTGYLSLSGVIAGVSDGAAVKAAKLAMSSMVPVVGGMISDASETVLASAQILKSAAGVFGMLAVLAICILPLIRLGIQFLILKLTAAVSATVGEKPLVDLIESISDAMGFLMGATGACGFMLLISCVCSIKAVSI